MAERKEALAASTSLSEFVKFLTDATADKEDVKASDELLERTIQELRNHRQKYITIESSTTQDVVDAMEAEGELCKHVDSRSLGVTVDILLQSGNSRLKERGLYLLAESLHSDQHDPERSKRIQARKNAVGKVCLERLLAVFSGDKEEKSMNSVIRRPVGLLLIRLLSGCEKNMEKLEAAPEMLKRKLGPLVLHERDDILRIIRGQLVQVLITEEENRLTLADLWPSDAKSQIYSGFPALSQENNPWINAFQQYIDGFFERPPFELPAAGVYFVQAIDTSSHYPVRFFRRTICVVVSTNISIYALPSKTNFDEFVDVPRNLIWKTDIEDIDIDHPRLNEKPVRLIVKLQKTNDNMCYWNGKPILVGEIRFTISNRDTATTLLNDLLAPHVEAKKSSNQGLVPPRKQKVSQAKSPIHLSQDRNHDQSGQERAVREASFQERKSENITLEVNTSGSEDDLSNNAAGPRKEQNVRSAKVNQKGPDSDRDELAGGDSNPLKADHIKSHAKKPSASTKLNHDEKAKSKKISSTTSNIRSKASEVGHPATVLVDEYSLDESNDNQQPPLKPTEAAEYETVKIDHKTRSKTKKYNLRPKSPIGVPEASSHVTRSSAPTDSRGKGPNTRVKGVKSAKEPSTSKETEKSKLPKANKSISTQNKTTTARKGNGLKKSGGGGNEQDKPNVAMSKSEDNNNIHTSAAPKQAVTAVARTRRKAAAEANAKIHKMSSSDNELDEVHHELDSRFKNKAQARGTGGTKVPDAARRQSPRLKEKVKQNVTKEPDAIEDPIGISDDQESAIADDNDDPGAIDDGLTLEDGGIYEVAEETTGQQSTFFEDSMAYQEIEQASAEVFETKEMIKPQLIQPTVDFAVSLASMLKPSLGDHPPGLNKVQNTTKAQSPNVKQTLLTSGVKQMKSNVKDDSEKQDSSHVLDDMQVATENAHQILHSSGLKRRVSDEDRAPEKTAKFDSAIPAQKTSVRDKTPAARSISRETPDTPARHPQQLQRKKSATPPANRSPLLLTEVQTAATEAAEALIDHRELVDDHLARKPPMVGFSVKGPVNQGYSSAKGSPRGEPKYGSTEKERQSPTSISDPQREEKQMLRNIAKNHLTQNTQNDQADNLVVQNVQTMPFHIRRRNIKEGRLNLLGEQPYRSTSRRPRTVTDDGSPIGSRNTFSKMSNMESIAKRLFEPTMVEDSEAPSSEPMNPDFEQYKDELPTLVNEDMDGLAISNNTKIQPSSPHEVVPQMVPHRKTRTGRYEEVASDQFISPHEQQENPFFGSGTSMKVTKLTRRFQDKVRGKGDSRKALPPITTSRLRLQEQVEDQERTLVEVELSSPEQLSSKSSDASQDEDNSFEDSNAVDDKRKTESDWRDALKPHQKTILDTLYQISNDLLRLLVEPEEAIDNVLEDYVRNGKVLLQDAEDRHRKNRNGVQQDFSSWTEELYGYYKESHASIRQKLKLTEKASILDVERNWLLQRRNLKSLFRSRSELSKEADAHIQNDKKRKKTESTSANFENKKARI